MAQWPEHRSENVWSRCACCLHLLAVDLIVERRIRPYYSSNGRSVDNHGQSVDCGGYAWKLAKSIVLEVVSALATNEMPILPDLYRVDFVHRGDWARLFFYRFLLWNTGTVSSSAFLTAALAN